jgi:hypothetical protein
MIILFEDVVRDAMRKRMTFDTIGGGGRVLRGLIRPRKAHRHHGRLHSSCMIGKRLAVVRNSNGS